LQGLGDNGVRARRLLLLLAGFQFLDDFLDARELPWGWGQLLLLLLLRCGWRHAVCVPVL
jgi:hypothetical protein